MDNPSNRTPYRSGKLIGNITIGLFLGTVLTAILNILLSIMMIAFGPIIINTEEGSLDAAWIFVGVVGLVQLLFRLLLIVFFLVWVFRMFVNLRALGAQYLEHTPGWSIGWWFIPFANLVKPFLIVREAYRESHQLSHAEPENAPYPSFEIGGFWWVAFLISGGILRVSDTLAGDANRDASMYFPVAYMVGHLFLATAAVLGAIIVKRIVDWQETASKIQRLGEPVMMPPPPPVFEQDKPADSNEPVG